MKAEPLPAPAVNRLIDALPRSERTRLLAACESVDLRFAQVLCDAGQPLDHLYFPTTGFLSLITPVPGHHGLEVAMVGNESAAGLSLVLGQARSPLRLLVQGAGSALRIAAPALRLEMQRSATLRGLLERSIAALLTRTARMAACTRFHLVEERLARWLLTSQDCAHSAQLHVTHEFLAYMLGVRRAGITKAATALQERQLIRYHRGAVTILDRGGLEAISCGCYQADRADMLAALGPDEPGHTPGYAASAAEPATTRYAPKKRSISAEASGPFGSV
ncbi:Crp/Fnr family transcriptional regulator [Methylibium sp.]|uniref:Crp/Fnr family transcriptional regulator n=1 Tax=Methylibium sp. TaxID=2067992 RepID=UPI0025D0DBA6|nr:Crp/Fnr family transcriptional regulator [Methylibium sp.]